MTNEEAVKILKSEVECFTLEELESWLWENVLNNYDNTYGEFVEELINRLDGFKEFVKDRRVEKQDTAENLHREKEQAYYKGFEDGRKMLLDRMKGDTE